MFNKRAIKPMLLKEVDKPFNDKDYIYELKYDGIRVIVYVSKDSLHIISRNGNDITKLFSELQSLKGLVKEKVVFDGEIVTFDKGKPSFLKLQSRTSLKRLDKIEHIKEEIPVAFICFDILYENKDLMDLPLIERKEILDKYSDTDYFIKTKVYEDGNKLFKSVKKLDLEGIIAKKKDSIYISGKRVDSWLKIKNFKKGNFYIHSYIIGKEKISFLLGEYKNKKLYYVGKVSVMPEVETAKKVLKLKKKKCQFENISREKEANYVEPKIKILVHYMERTSNNHLRQPFIKSKKA